MKAALFLLILAGLQSLAAAERPNFLLIIADDSTWSDYGFAGNEEVRMPNLDTLRSEGLETEMKARSRQGGGEGNAKMKKKKNGSPSPDAA